MKKKIKIALFLCLLSVMCALIFSSCNIVTENDNFEMNLVQFPSNTNTQTRVETPLEKEHKELISKLSNISYEAPYSELYSLYSTVVSHKSECGCEIKFNQLLDYMLLGEWADTTGYIIRFTYVFTDYNDQNGVTGYETNLKTSKEAGKSYYYYFDHKDDNLIIGYEDIATNEKTDNLVLKFFEEYISVESKIESKTYTLYGNFEYNKVVKGKAKLAYEHIIGVISTFEAPEKIVITNCYVHYPNDHVYITIEYENDEGTKVKEQYELTVSNGQYQKKVFPYLAAQNVDANELNQMIQDFLKDNVS